jgi:2-keto-4-pentenoate hydratase/2-oxohepta-3-ene-1,7-dioic acid hydratase in catechol pathway
MKLATIQYKKGDIAAVMTAEGALPVEALNRTAGLNWPQDMLELIQSGLLEEMSLWWTENGRGITEKTRKDIIPLIHLKYLPPYRFPSKIWGIGLNYREHATDLSEKVPDSIPGSFMKPCTTIIGHRQPIIIPELSKKTTAEGELALIIGKKCKDVPMDKWREVIAGFTTVIDMTAEDILRKNPRYLTLSKSFDTFFSFGPVVLTTGEIEDVLDLKVATCINDRIHAENKVANMAFTPDFLVSFHSSVMTLLPGDIISTGTPGAVAIKNEDMVECRIDGFEPLVNPVKTE